jgi:predicted ThiF/HesA family dinucleotide-utilizing enzyme
MERVYCEYKDGRWRCVREVYEPIKVEELDDEASQRIVSEIEKIFKDFDEIFSRLDRIFDEIFERKPKVRVRIPVE